MNSLTHRAVFFAIFVAFFASFVGLSNCFAKNFEIQKSDQASNNSDADDSLIKSFGAIKSKDNSLSKSLNEILNSLSNDSDMLGSVDSLDVFGFDDAPFAERDPF